MMATPPYRDHLSGPDDLVTTYAATRAGFVSLALEKSRQATPFVEQARALKVSVTGMPNPVALLELDAVHGALLTAAGVSDKAAEHLELSDKRDAIAALIQNFLEPQGEKWIEELVYRFLLTRGDTLGGMMRNIGGELAERKVSRAIMSALVISGRKYVYFDSESGKWLPGPVRDADIEHRVNGLSWFTTRKARTLVYNIKAPAVNKNVDLCLLDCAPSDIATGRLAKVVYGSNELYLALGELKGGIDPAGADEHWKTASTALKRIETAFREKQKSPRLFFIGAAIERDMAAEIWRELEDDRLANAANLTSDVQIASLCRWLCGL